MRIFWIVGFDDESEINWLVPITLYSWFQFSPCQKFLFFCISHISFHAEAIGGGYETIFNQFCCFDSSPSTFIVSFSVMCILLWGIGNFKFICCRPIVLLALACPLLSALTPPKDLSIKVLSLYLTLIDFNNSLLGFDELGEPPSGHSRGYFIHVFSNRDLQNPTASRGTVT